ncbi:HAD family hydrolase [Sporofaciens musculi]|jgi:phosphoglycolate phosphatase|uniref:HAD family hydrolase n=1 Tax=Sporofaciens musculi TaxID=2681861 RepID=UPI0025A1ADE5|nr:HAD family hydrolase [Sporofaciens musculi]
MNNKNKSYDIFFFDLDGTLTDSSLGITNSVIYALKKFGIEETDRSKLYSFIGPPLLLSFEKFYGFSKEQSMDAVRYYREYYCDRGIFENRVYDGMENVLKELKNQGKLLVVATSKPEPFARQIIEHFHLMQFFDYVAGMEMDGRRQTKEEVIRYALDTCRITDKSKVLMVGDREYDVIGAQALGIDCLGILYGFGCRDELEKAGADYIAETVEEILGFA